HVDVVPLKGGQPAAAPVKTDVDVAVVDKPAIDKPVSDKPASVDPAEDVPAKPVKSDKVAVAEPKDVDTPKPAVEPVPLPAPRLLYTSKEGKLLNFDKTANDFLVLPWRAEVKPHDRLACPEPFRADFLV